VAAGLLKFCVREKIRKLPSSNSWGTDDFRELSQSRILA
jgi:hypothetical protein